MQKIKTCSTKKSNVILPTYQCLDFFFKASLFLEEEPCVARAFVDRKVEREVRCLQVDHQDEADGELYRSKAENQEGERG